MSNNTITGDFVYSQQAAALGTVCNYVNFSLADNGISHRLHRIGECFELNNFNILHVQRPGQEGEFDRK